MNGLDSKHYWVNFFMVNFILSMVTSLNMFIFGRYIIDIAFFKETSFVLLWIIFIGWAIAMISLTSFVQIFINNSKTATIVGYLLYIFSNLLGGVLVMAIFPYPMKIPTYLLMFPPFALGRIVYHLGWACADTSGCFQSVFTLNSELILCITILYLWFFVYLLSIWLNDMVQQEYGVAKRPYWVEKCMNICRKEKSEMLIE